MRNNHFLIETMGIHASKSGAINSFIAQFSPISPLSITVPTGV
jgi:hypothetical protein